LIIIRAIINNCAPIIIDNNWALNHHIRMISERSCDTEDWSNDRRKKLHFKAAVCCLFEARIIVKLNVV